MNARYCDAITGRAQPEREAVQERQGLLFIYPSVPCWGAGGAGHSWAGSPLSLAAKDFYPRAFTLGQAGRTG